MQKGLGQWGPPGRGRQGVKKGGVAQKQHRLAMLQINNALI